MHARRDVMKREGTSMFKLDTGVLHHPAVVAQFHKRASDVQIRIADRITAFAGSMHFVYLHAVLFAAWMLVFERRARGRR
jgi:uncharacterized membrane protein